MLKPDGRKIGSLALQIGWALAFLMAVTALAWMADLRVNVTPSEPMGLWRIGPIARRPAVGDLVFICPPDTVAIRAALARGYLRRGSCAGGFAPLIKTIIATGGQRVTVDRNVRVDGHVIPASFTRPRDGRGRLLTPYSGGTIALDEIFLLSSFVQSFDSRYFGPVPATGVLGLARKVLTYAP